MDCNDCLSAEAVVLLMTDSAVDGFINCVPYLDGAREEGFLVCKCAGKR